MDQATESINPEKPDLTESISILQPANLLGLGLTLGFIVVFVLAYQIRFPLWRYASLPHGTFAQITSINPWMGARLLLGALAALLFNVGIWIYARRFPGKTTLAIILVGWLVASLVLLFTQPGWSTDMGDYIFRAHMIIHMHANPLTTPPDSLISLSQFPYLSWYGNVDPYGPVWHLFSVLTHLVAGETIYANLLAYKFLEILATALTGLFIFLILQRLAPDYTLAGLAIWLWSPVVLTHGALDGHNDFLMTAFILAGACLLLRGGKTTWLGLLFFIVAALVKVTAIILFPFALVWLWRELGWWKAFRVALPALLVGMLITWLSYLPFGGWQLLVSITANRGWWSTGTWTAALFYFLRDGHQFSQAFVVRWVIGANAVLFGLVLVWILWRVHDFRNAIWAAALAFLLIGSPWFQAWYAVTFIALAAIVTDRRLVIYTFIFSIFLLLQPILTNYWVSTLQFAPGGYDLLMSAVILLVPQLLAIYLWLIYRRRAAPIPLMS